MSNKMTVEELVRETIKRIGMYGRAATCNNHCHYLLKERRCAVGLWLENPEYFGIMSARTMLDKYGTYILKKEVRHFGIQTWAQLQAVHDGNHFWLEDNKTLSEEGKQIVMQLFNIAV